MGRYVAVGLACEINIYGTRFTYGKKFDELRNDIVEHVGKYINLDDYSIVHEEDKITFKIKEEIVDEHIHSLLREISKIFDIKEYFFRHIFKNFNSIDVESESFNQNNYDLRLRYLDEIYDYKNEHEKFNHCDRYGLISNGELFSGVDGGDGAIWMFFDNKKLLNSVRAGAEYLSFWSDYNKIGEESIEVLQLLNIFSNSYFKNRLAKDLQFYITL